MKPKADEEEATMPLVKERKESFEELQKTKSMMGYDTHHTSELERDFEELDRLSMPS